MIISREKFNYADVFDFEFHIVLDGERRVAGSRLVWFAVHPEGYMFSPSFTNLVFVHNEAEAKGFPDNVVVAWPRMGERNFSEGLVKGFNWAINRGIEELTPPHRTTPMRDVIILDEFGLSYPLTVADLVDNWDKVNELWNAFTSAERSNINAFGGVGIPHVDNNANAIEPKAQ